MYTPTIGALTSHKSRRILSGQERILSGTLLIPAAPWIPMQIDRRRQQRIHALQLAFPRQLFPEPLHRCDVKRRCNAGRIRENGRTVRAKDGVASNIGGRVGDFDFVQAVVG